MTKTLVLTGTLAAAACCAALAPGAAPAAGKKPVQAAFDVRLSGTQVSTWEYHTDTLKDDRCGSKVDAYGDQTFNYGSLTDGRMIVYRRSARQFGVVLLAGTKDRDEIWNIGITADRNGTRVVDLGTNRDDCGNNGGGVVPRDRQDRACGVRVGRLTPDLDDIRTGRLQLTGETSGWTADQTAPADGTAPGDTDLEETYERCPFWESGPYGPESEASLLPTRLKLPLQRLLDGKKSKHVFAFGATKDYREGAFTGRTILTGKLRLIRIKNYKPVVP